MSAGPARRIALLVVLTVAVASAGAAAAPVSVAAWDPGDPDAASEALLTG
jgi:hypothetical protein